MPLFDQLVDEALKSQNEMAPLRPVVEKELLHHDILRELAQAGLLRGLTFIGGTCLRACYGSQRLSEDLDFTGGFDFTRDALSELADLLEDRIQVRYEFPVRVSVPKKTGGSVSTWKMTVETRPGQPHLPAQRIHIDICAIPSHDPRPMMLRNLYDVDLGTSGLILQAQSREEILADKIIAFAFRENRIKNRDLWDIGWLNQTGVELPTELIPRKIEDHYRKPEEFTQRIGSRLEELQDEPKLQKDFVAEMQRFLPAALQEAVSSEDYWRYMTQVVTEQCEKAMGGLG